MMSESDFRLPMLAARKDSQPLMLNNQSHPAYQPVKLSVKTAVDMKSSKIRAPEKPMSPYMRYARKVGESVKLAHPEAKAWEVGKIIANMWRDLNDMERQDYINEYEAAKAEYGEQLKQYHNSPQYQSFLSNNSKKKYPIIGQPGGMAISGGSSSSANAIEPAEEDGIDDSLSNKHVAASRYLRNHRLLNEIFSEYVVPDSRSIITMQRMDQLKKQVHSLEMHHEKLKQELNLIEEKFETKKKRILTDSDNFNNELNKLKEFKVSDEHTTSYYSKHYDQLQKQWKEHCDRFLAANAHKLNENDLQHQLRESLENLVNVNKNLISVSNPQSVTVVALQVADHPSATTSGSSTTTPATSSSNASQLTASTQSTAVAAASSQPAPTNYTSHPASSVTVAPPPQPVAPSNPTISNISAAPSHHTTPHHQSAPTQQQAHHQQAAPGQVVGHMPMNTMPTLQQNAIYGQMPMQQSSGQPQQQPPIHPMQMHGPNQSMMQQMTPQMMSHPSQHPNMPSGTQQAPSQQQQAGSHSSGQVPPGVVNQPQVGYMQMQPQGQNPQQGQIMMHQQQPAQGQQPNPSQHNMMAPPHHPHMMMPQQAMYGQQGPMMQPMMYQYQPTQQPQQPGMIQTPEMMQQNQQAMFQPQIYNQQQYMQQQQHQVYQMQRGGVVPSYQQQPGPQGSAAPRMQMPMNMMQPAPGQTMQMTPQGMMMVNKPQASGPQPQSQQNQPGSQPQQPQGAQNQAQTQQQGQQVAQQAPPPQYMGYMMQPGVQPQYIQQAPAGGQPQPGQFQYQQMPPNPGAPPPQGMYNGSAPMYYNNPNNPDYRVK